MHRIRDKLFSLAMTLVILTTIIAPLNVKPTQAATIGSSQVIPVGAHQKRSTGGIKSDPGFAIGLVSDKGFNLDLSDEDATRQSIISYYGNSLPYSIYNFVMVPDAIWNLGEAALTWYDASAGVMRQAEAKDFQRKYQRIDSNRVNENPYTQMLLDNSDQVNLDLSPLANGKWLSISGSKASEAKKMWNYILYEYNNPSAYKIDKKIDILTRYDKYEEALPEEKDQKKFEMQAAYLGLLISVYYCVPTDYRDYYYAEIERYIKGENLDTNPVLLSIQVVANFTAKDHIPGKDVLSTTFPHLVGFLTGAAPRELLYKGNSASNSWNTEDIILDVTRASVNKLPNRARTTDTYIESNAFSFGLTGLFGKRLHSKPPRWTTTTNVDFAVGKTLYLSSPDHYGAMLVQAGIVAKTPMIGQGGFSVSTNTPNTVVLPANQVQIGEDVLISVKGNLTVEERENMEKLIFTKVWEPGYPKIAVQLSTDNGQSYTLNSGHQFNSSTPVLGIVLPRMLAFPC